jgi:site-specific recombinase XerD
MLRLGLKKPTLQECCQEFLDEIRLHRSPKTFKQYRTALTYFQQSCGPRRLVEVDRRTMLAFRQFLAEAKGLSMRTVCTKLMVVEQMLKAMGVSGLMKRGDCCPTSAQMGQFETAKEATPRNLQFTRGAPP